MADNEELSSLERVRQRLYNPQAPVSFEEPRLAERPVESSRGWGKIRNVQKEADQISGPARFFIVALLFFLVTAGGAVFYLVYGGRSVSTNNLILTTQGPTSISSGDTVPLLVTLQNKNPVALRGVTITITYPEGTKAADDPTKPMTLYTENLGDIDSGAQVSRTVRSVVYGSEGQHVVLPIKIEYHTDNSNAVFVKNKQYDFTVTTSPISLTVDALSQASAGQPVTVRVTLKSNATTPLDNVAVLAEYPFGFTPTATTPQPTTGTLFSFGTLAPGQEQHITITGVLSGQNNDDRVFKFNAGTLSAPGANTLATSFTEKDADIKLTAPFLATTLAINRDTTETPVIDAGVPVPVVVSWTNTLATPVTNAHVTVTLGGEGLDAASVTSGTGFYRSSDTTVLFDSTTNPSLAMLQPGDTGQGSFTFASKNSSVLASLRNPSVTMRVNVSGQRLSEVNVPETISSTLSRTVKVGTNLGLSTRIVHSIGPFKNTGPWPPTANTETTYTVNYTLSNTGNTVAGAKITVALPSYIRFTGSVSPSDGSITYNETTRTVTWEAGDVTSGSASAKTASFQIGFTPSTTQVGQSPTLITAQQVSGVDRFTQHQILGSQPSLSTQITSDPAYSAQDGSVK